MTFLRAFDVTKSIFLNFEKTGNKKIFYRVAALNRGFTFNGIFVHFPFGPLLSPSQWRARPGRIRFGADQKVPNNAAVKPPFKCFESQKL